MHRLKVLTPEGLSEEAVVHPSTEPPWIVTFSGAGLREEKFTGSDLFDALAQLRLRLESIGSSLLCAGSRRDVYPSGMARSMGSARRAYVFELGKPATALVDIFDGACAEQVATVSEQRAAFDAWCKSLREKR